MIFGFDNENFFEHSKRAKESRKKSLKIISAKNTIKKAAFSWKVPAFAPVAV